MFQCFNLKFFYKYANILSLIRYMNILISMHRSYSVIIYQLTDSFNHYFHLCYVQYDKGW